MPDIKQLRSSVQRKSANVYDTFFTRRVSIYLTVLVASVGMTPNQVSAASAAVALGSCVLIGLGSPIALLVGTAGVHLYAVLDSVDGELARLTGRFSLVGLFIEDLSAYLMINAFNLAVGWRLYVDTHVAWPLVVAVLVTALGRSVMPAARRAMMKSIGTRRPRLECQPIDPKPDSPTRAFLTENFVHSTNQWVVLSATLALAEWHLVSFSVPGAIFGATMALAAAKEAWALAVLLRNHGLDRELARVYSRAAAMPETDSRHLSTYSPL